MVVKIIIMFLINNKLLPDNLVISLFKHDRTRPLLRLYLGGDIQVVSDEISTNSYACR